jgi:hypothetical protein
MKQVSKDKLKEAKKSLMQEIAALQGVLNSILKAEGKSEGTKKVRRRRRKSKDVVVPVPKKKKHKEEANPTA